MKARNFYILIGVLTVLGWIWLFSSFFFDEHQIKTTVCLSKRVTDVPCPSCGTTRSVLSFFKGDFLKALYWNPLGILSAIFLIISPLWLLFDFIFQKKSFYGMFLKMENFLKKWYIFVPLILLVAINWIWNICKGV